MDEHWKSWNTKVVPKKLKDMELTKEFTVDFEHVSFNPSMFQPATLNTCNHYKTYFISQRKVIMIISTAGKDYAFCDRFTNE
jgi:hypothetical protein